MSETIELWQVSRVCAVCRRKDLAKSQTDIPLSACSKLSREPHGRVISNVYVSKGPIGMPPVTKPGKVNFVKPGHLQEMAE
jgi:hypothetical protein